MKARARAVALVAGALLAVHAGAALAATFYVDGANSSSNDSNPGTEVLPFRTIFAAVSAGGGPGNTIIVKPFVYREQVTIPASGNGAEGNPFVIQGQGPGVIVDGADAFTTPNQWALHAGSVYRASSVSWNAKQVLVDGVRCSVSTAAPESLAVGRFRYISGSGLYLNVGGTNPGTHQTYVGRRAHGFRLSGRTYVTIRGITVTRTEDRGIYLSSGANFNTVERDTVTFSNLYGITVANSTGALIQDCYVADGNDHGIHLTGMTNSIIRRNESLRNARPNVRAANGIFLGTSSGILVEANRTHHNQDTGINLASNANDNRFVQNVSWSNGDHGFDHLGALNNVHIGDVVYGNFKDGFSIEGGSTGTQLHNCILVENGLTQDEFNLWVAADSQLGFVSDYNIIWNSTSQQPIRWGPTKYSSVPSYGAASGQDSHSLQLDPRFVDPASGNFRLLGGSPAIDNATSAVANWPATDADGRSRIDDPSTANSGAGPVLFADRGAYEFVPGGGGPDNAPVVSAPATVSIDENSVMTVVVNVSDPDGNPITNLTADLSALPLGNNAGFTTNATKTQGTLTWTPSFDDARPTVYSVTFTATNTLASSARTDITVLDVDRPPNIVSPATRSGAEGQLLTISLGVNDPDGDAIDTVTVDGLPPGADAVLTMNAAKTSGQLSWTPSFAAAPGPYTVRFIAANALADTSVTQVTIANVDQAPIVSAPSSVNAAERDTVRIVVHAADLDGDAITNLTANFSSLPPGHGASFTTAAGETTGTFVWVPSFDHAGGPYSVAFTAMNTLQGSATSAITIMNLDRPPLVIAPDTVVVAEGQEAVAAITALDPDGQTIVSLLPNPIDFPPGPTSFTPNGTNTAGTFRWTPGFSAAPGIYTVRFTAANSASGYDSTAFRVTNIDRPPIVVAVADTFAAEDVAYSQAITASDPDGDAITNLQADLTGLPPGDATFAHATNTFGTLSWTPQTGDLAGSPYRVIFRATNGLEGADTTFIHIDRPPVVTAPATRTVAENDTLRFTVTASDPDGQGITAFTAPGMPAGARFTPDPSKTSGIFEWVPGFAAAPGPYAVVFAASNGPTGRDTTMVWVTNVDRAPVVSAPSSAPIVDEELLTFEVYAADPDGQPLDSLVVEGLPAGATFNASGDFSVGTFSWIPPAGAAAAGPYVVRFVAANTLSGADTTVLSGDRAPVVTAPATRTVAEGQTLTFTVTAADPDTEAVFTLGAVNLPPGASFDVNGAHTSGTFTWTPGFDASGTVSVVFVATNALPGRDTTVITIQNTDRAPTVTAPQVLAGTIDVPISFTVSVADPDGDAIDSLEVIGLPSGATFTAGANNLGGTFQWTPAVAQLPGPYAVIFVAANTLTGRDTTTITLDRAPVVTAPAAQSATEGQTLSFSIAASDPDAQAISSLDATGLPSGASFAANGGNTGGTFTWTPNFDQAPGPYRIIFSATNLLSGADTTDITVQNTDRAPVVSAPGAATVGENQQITIVIDAIDLDGDAISSLSMNPAQLPPGNNATFVVNEARTQGTLTWTPTSNDGRGAPYAVTFTAANALSQSSTTQITVIDAILNLCTNPSFEINTTGWSGYPSGTTLARVGGGQEGSSALRVTGPASTAQFGANDSPNFVNSATAGTRYRYSAWVRSTGATGQAQLRVREYASGGGLAGIATTSLVPLSANWQFLVVDYVGVGSGNTLDFQVLETPTAASQQLFVDNVAVYVASGTSAPIVTAPTTVTVDEGALLTVNVTAADPDGEPISMLTADLAGLPAGGTSNFTTNGAKTAGTFTWTPPFNVGPGSYNVGFAATNTSTGTATTTIQVDNVDRAPAVTAPATASGAENQALTFTVTALDPDGDSIDSLTAVGLPAGATFTANALRTSGDVHWTPGFAAAGPHVIVFRARNALSGADTTVLTVGNTDRAPVVVAPAAESATEGVELTFEVTASDVDGDAIGSLTVGGLPGASFDLNETKTSGTVRWTPAYDAAPSYTAIFTAANTLSGADTTVITVTNVDRAPVVVAPGARTAVEGSELMFTVTASDPDGDSIDSLRVAGLPAGAAYDVNGTNTSATVTWTPGFDEAGNSYTVIFTAANARSGADTTVITVTNVDRAPVVVAPGARTAVEGSELTFTVTASDPDGDSIDSLRVAGLPAGAAYDVNGTNTSATVTWTPGFDEAGNSYTVIFTAANARSGADTTEITVTNVDRAPVVVAPGARTAVEGSELTFTVTASDVDGDGIGSLLAAGLPAGVAYDVNGTNTSATVTWTPGFDEAGNSYTVIFTAANDLSGADTTVITVSNTDRAPLVVAPAVVGATEGAELTFTVTASDADGDGIDSLRVAGLPAGAAYDVNGTNTSATVTWTPGFDEGGNVYTVIFTAANTLSGTDTTVLTVGNTDRAPVVVAPAAESATEGAELTFEVTASDVDGDAIGSLTVGGLPGASFDLNETKTSGTVRWTPAYDAAPSYTAIFTVANTLSGADTTVITVTNVDRAPVVVAPGARTAVEGSELTFTVTASDPDGDGIDSLRVAGLPAGAVFAANEANTSATVTWTPGFDEAGNSYTVIFTAANARSGADTTVITVGATDRAPVVVAPGARTAVEGSELTFTVTASDPDGDSIDSLRVAGLPAGAAYDVNGTNTSATVTWTPGFDEAGNSYTVIFTAANARSGADTTEITVTNVDRAPVVVAPGARTAVEGSELTFTVTASDVDGDGIGSLLAAGLPAGVAYDVNGTNTSATVTWTPGFDEAGNSYTVIFTAANDLSGADTTVITVSNTDRAPLVVAPAVVGATEGAELTFTVTASDADGDGIDSLRVAGLPAGAAYDVNGTNTSATVTWTPGFDEGGNVYTVIFTAANTLSGADTTVVRVGTAPVVVAPASQSVAEGQLLTFIVTASDADGDTIASLTPVGLPAGANFAVNGTRTSGTFTWTPGFAVAPTTVSVVFTAANTLSGADTTEITVSNTDRAPVVTAPATAAATEGQLLTFNVTATDSDGTAIDSLTATGLPSGATFTAEGGNASGTFSWTPPAGAAPGPYTVAFAASNALSGADTTVIDVAASAVNLCGNPSFETNTSGWSGTGSPTLTRVSGGHHGSFALQLKGPNTTGSFGLNDGPNWIAAAGGTGKRYRFTAWVRSVANTGSVRIRIREYVGSSQVGSLYSSSATLSPAWQMLVVDYVTTATTSALDFNVMNSPVAAGETILVDDLSIVLVGGAADRAPVVSAPASASATEGQQVSVAVTASDPDGNAITSLTANLSGLPSGHNAVFTAGSGNTSGTLTWTPVFTAAPGPYSVTFTATNALTGAATTSITVANVTSPPVVTAPATAAVTEGQLLTLQVTVSDPDGDPIDSLVAVLSDLPSGSNAVFTTNPERTSGTLTWTPVAADVRANPYPVTFRARNSQLTTATTNITVNANVANLCGNPGFETNTAGWSASGNSTLTRVAGGRSGSFALQITGPNTTGQFGLNDSPNWIGAVAGAGVRYRYSAWVRSTANTGSVRLKVREYVGGTQFGSTTYSAPVTLSAAWQQVAVEYVSTQSSSMLDFQLLDTPVATGETMLVDDVVIVTVGAEPSLPAPNPALSAALVKLEFMAGVAPNPCRSADARLSFSVTRQGPVRVRVFDVRGREVGAPMDAVLAPGRHGVALPSPGRRLASGVYFYRLEAAEGTRTGRFVVVD